LPIGHDRILVRFSAHGCPPPSRRHSRFRRCSRRSLPRSLQFNKAQCPPASA
jgi:hypothetical protein